LTRAKIYQGPEISFLYGKEAWLNEEDYGVAAGADIEEEYYENYLFNSSLESGPKNELF